MILLPGGKNLGGNNIMVHRLQFEVDIQDAMFVPSDRSAKDELPCSSSQHVKAAGIKVESQSRGPTPLLLEPLNLQEKVDLMYAHVTLEPLASANAEIHNISAPSQSAELQIGGALVERVLETSLPEMVTEVSRKQQNQHDDLAHHRQVLQQAKEVLETEVTKRNLAEKEEAALSRQVCLLEGDIARLQEKLQGLNNELSCAIDSRVALERQVHHVETASRDETKHVHECKVRMREYAERMLHVEATRGVNKAVVEKRGHVEELKKQLIDEGVSGDGSSDAPEISGANGREVEVNDLRVEIATLEQTSLETEKRTHQIEAQILSEQEKQKALQQNIDVLHKRNAACLVRLTRQLSEARPRRQQWCEQRTRLRASVEALRGEVGGNQSEET